MIQTLKTRKKKEEEQMKKITEDRIKHLNVGEQSADEKL